MKGYELSGEIALKNNHNHYNTSNRRGSYLQGVRRQLHCGLGRVRWDELLLRVQRSLLT